MCPILANPIGFINTLSLYQRNPFHEVYGLDNLKKELQQIEHNQDKEF